MTSTSWHPNAPTRILASVDLLVDRVIGCVRQALSEISPQSAAFALCLWTADDPSDLTPATVSVGVNDDRTRIVAAAGSPWEAFVDVWIASDYTYDVLGDYEDPPDHEDARAAAGAVCDWLDSMGIADYARWVFEEAAQRLTTEPPLSPVTDDFVAFVFAQGHELVQSLRWIAPPRVQALLEDKRLLVDDFDNLPGAPT